MSRLKCGVPRQTGSAYVIVFCVLQIIFIFYPCSVTDENRTHVHMTFMPGNELKNEILNYCIKPLNSLYVKREVELERRVCSTTLLKHVPRRHRCCLI
jgi:hypothetical protein